MHTTELARRAFARRVVAILLFLAAVQVHQFTQVVGHLRLPGPMTSPMGVTVEVDAHSAARALARWTAARRHGEVPQETAREEGRRVKGDWKELGKVVETCRRQWAAH